MTWKQAVTIAVLFGLISAALVWFLEDFNRKRMADEWLQFVREHGVTGQADG